MCHSLIDYLATHYSQLVKEYEERVTAMIMDLIYALYLWIIERLRGEE